MTEFEKYLKLEIEQVEKDQKLEDTEYRQGKKYAYYTALNAFKKLFIHSVSNWVDCDSLPEHLEKVLVFGKIEPWSENELHTAVLNKAGGLNHWYTGGTRMHEVSKWKRIIAPPCY